MSKYLFLFIIITFLSISCAEEESCKDNYYFNNNRCEPVCKDDQLYNSDLNICEYIEDCNDNFVYNKNRNRCEPTCREDELYNSSTNRCERDSSCIDNFNYNYTRKRCEPICTNDQIYNITTNSCEENSYNCEANFNYNSDRERCEPICTPQQTYNIDNNSCEDTDCENHFIYNLERERCEPICQDYQNYNIDENSCVDIEILTKELYNLLFKNSRAAGKSSQCPGYNFYNYNAFKEALLDYPEFGNEGKLEDRKREIAAFFANISHETTGGWSGHGEDRYYWGLCFIEEQSCKNVSSEKCIHCSTSSSYECVAGKSYHGRGPIQLTWNYNYGAMGDVLDIDLLSKPELLATDPIISFKTALWFWMTPQSPKPSAHDVMTKIWSPNQTDINKNRKPGFGMTINIINGGNECGSERKDRFIKAATDRVKHFKKFCDILSVTYGSNLDCGDMEHY